MQLNKNEANHPLKNRTYSSSSSDDNDPYDIPENYYGPRTNPSKTQRDFKTGIARTYSVSEKKSKFDLFNAYYNYNNSNADTTNKISLNQFNDNDTIQEQPSSENSSTSTSSINTPILERKAFILPLYNNVSTDSIGNISQKKVEKYYNDNLHHYRRASVDDSYLKPKKFYINDIELTLKELLKNEDTNHDYQITIEDNGPKVLKLGTVNSNGFKQSDIRGTYMLSNLLQELTIARRLGRNKMILDEARLSENPVSRMRRFISTQFWKALTREINKENIIEMSMDTKIKEECFDNTNCTKIFKDSYRIYIPFNRKDQYDYFKSISQDTPLDIQFLPEKIDAKFIRSINKKPGLLALSAKIDPNDSNNLINEPYAVPGGRFNELYGWDSYMMTLGLLTDVTINKNHDHLNLAKSMTENLIYEINHYGKILNANRSYYLGRSQPPFLTDMTLRIFNKFNEIFPEKFNESIDFLKRSTVAAIKEHNNVWCSLPRYDKETGLSCYHPEGIGIPPETESTHFNSILKPYIDKYNIIQDEFVKLYNNDKIIEPELDEYFLHDRAVRESGHDTSYRLEGKCAYLATVDLNSLLYKYETDIAFIIKNYFNDNFTNDSTGEIEISEKWIEKSKIRKSNITKYLWNENDSIFYDYNIKTKSQTGYESATVFWPLWAKVATKDQCDKLVKNSLSKFEEFGGLVSGTLKSRGEINIHRPSRQWDYPYGWAPQQILAWIGLANYGYEGITRRLVYRWLYLMTQAFVDYNGVVVEKYNVTKGFAPHKVDAEYGNQGLDFKGVATEGFGWVNASYLLGLTYMNLHAIRCLGALTPPDVFLRNMHPKQRELYE